jgi:hypothetical protein
MEANKRKCGKCDCNDCPCGCHTGEISKLKLEVTSLESSLEDLLAKSNDRDLKISEIKNLATKINDQNSDILLKLDGIIHN